MKAYRIKNADIHFETTETRRLKNLGWVPLPNRHDGKGYKRLLRLPGGPSLYAAWIGMLTVGSKCKPRWTLVDEEGPLSAQDLADKTDIPAKHYEKAFIALVSKEIGWIEEVDVTGICGNLRESAGECENNPSEGKGREGKEGKGKKEEIPPTPLGGPKPRNAWAEGLKLLTSFGALDAEARVFASKQTVIYPIEALFLVYDNPPESPPPDIFEWVTNELAKHQTLAERSEANRVVKKGKYGTDKQNPTANKSVTRDYSKFDNLDFGIKKPGGRAGNNS